MLALLLFAIAPPTGPMLDAEDVPLPDGALLRLGSARWRPGTFASDMAWSPDGKWLVVRNQLGHTLDVWDGKTGKRTARLAGYRSDGDMPQHDGPMAFSPDGTLAFTSRGRYLWHIEVPSGRLLRRYVVPDPKRSFLSVAFSADAKILTT